MIGDMKTSLDGLPGKLGLQAKVDMGDESKRRALDKGLDGIQETEKEISHIQDFNRDAGFIFASSGYRTAQASGPDPWPLDWSLTKLTSPRIMDNIIPGDASSVPADFMAYGTEANMWKNGPCVGHRVVKHGRSSGWTTGTVNAIETVISGNFSACGKTIVAWSVLPARFPNYFCYPEDSGSIVLDAEPGSPARGTWVGLLFAANLGYGIGYFIPMEVVLKDISLVTGCDVIEPTPFQ